MYALPDELRRWVACVVAGTVGLGVAAAPAQTQPAGYGTGGAYAATKPAPTTDQSGAQFKPEELEQIVAPVALYPDSLLSQILMAATYPVEVVQADRWVKGNSSIQGDALAKALEAQTWDPSVKSLTNFPEVLTMMSDKLDWTVKLGDAFIAQQSAVMEAVQKLRAKAQASGNLKSNEQQTVTVEAAPATQSPTATSTTQIITIAPANPQVIYVPTYNPTVVYGGWPYPAYPPYYYYPPSYNAAAVGISFGVGLAVGAAWGYAWGGCNWHHGDVDIDINRNININNNHIDRDKYKAEFNQRRESGTNRVGGTDRVGTSDRAAFQHDPSHRKGVAYRDQGTAQKFGGASSAQAVQAREAYRGRADAGRQEIGRTGPTAARQQIGSSGSGGARDLSRPSGGGTGGAGAGGHSVTPANRSGQSGGHSGGQSGSRSDAFNHAGSNGNQARSYSERGQSSRSSSNYSRSAPSRSAPARSAPSRGGGGGRRR